MRKKTIYTLITLLTGLALLLGCSSAPKPFEYHPGTEIPQGPGLFTKEKGEFMIYDSEQKPNSDQAQTLTPTTTEKGSSPGGDHEEFRQYQKWKMEQRELDKFKAWKKSPQGQKEYQEFQAWKRWKEYQQWQQDHPEGK